MEEKGHCKHGEFLIKDGCPQCIADRQAEEGNTEESIGEAIKVAGRDKKPLFSSILPADQTAIVKIAPSADEAVIALHEQSVKLAQYATALVITSDGNVKSATNDLSIISGLKKAIEEKRKEYTQPINEHLKAVNEAFKTLTEPLDRADRITRDKVLEYRQEQERQHREVEEIARLEREAAERRAALTGEPVVVPEVVEAPAIPDRYRAEMGTLGKMMVRKYRVVNFAELPDQYKIKNSALLNKVVKAGIPSIPGVEIYSEESLRVTRSVNNA